MRAWKLQKKYTKPYKTSYFLVYDPNEKGSSSKTRYLAYGVEDLDI